jgi:folate-binding protein YgfZ
MPEDPHPSVQGGTWSAPGEHLRLAVQRPVVAALTDLDIITVGGADAAQFLNGQLTVEVAALEAHRWQLGAYCSVKGRVLALFELWRDSDEFHLMLPAERAGPLRTALSRYVLRSKVRLEQQASGHWTVLGLTGPGIEQALQAAGFACPPTPWSTLPLQGGGRVARLPSSPRSGARFVLLMRAQSSQSWLSRLAGLVPVDRGVWWWSKIDAGLPDVFNATQERFVPQMLNLDVLGGVHFGKGCYPGQEVVARSQYLGKLRRRMARGSAEAASVGDDVLNGDNAGAVVGTVVMAARSPSGQFDLLLECPSDLAQTVSLRIAGKQPAQLTRSDLPYPLINPTA